MKCKREFKQYPSCTRTPLHVGSLEALKYSRLTLRLHATCPGAHAAHLILVALARPSALLLPATFPKLLSILAEPPATKLPNAVSVGVVVR